MLSSHYLQLWHKQSITEGASMITECFGLEPAIIFSLLRRCCLEHKLERYKQILSSRDLLSAFMLISKSVYSEFLLKFLESMFLTCFMLETETAILWSDRGLFALQALTVYEDIHVNQTLDVLPQSAFTCADLPLLCLLYGASYMGLCTVQDV